MDWEGSAQVSGKIITETLTTAVETAEVSAAKEVWRIVDTCATHSDFGFSRALDYSWHIISLNQRTVSAARPRS